MSRVGGETGTSLEEEGEIHRGVGGKEGATCGEGGLNRVGGRTGDREASDANAADEKSLAGDG